MPAARPPDAAVRWTAIAVAVVAVVLVAGPSYPAFVGYRAVAVAIAALGPGFVLVYGGRTSLGHGAFMAIGAYAGAACLRAGAGSGVSLGVAPLVAAGVGGALGWLFAHVRGPAFAAVTLAFQLGLDQLALRWPSVTGGHMGLAVPAAAGWSWWPVAVFVATALAATAALRAPRSAWADRWLALRDRPAAAAVSGVAERPHFAALMAASGAFSGLGGAMLVRQAGLVHPGQFTLIESVELLMIATLGGASFSGALLAAGVVVMTFVGLGGLAQFRSLAWAAVILALVVSRPRALRPELG